MVLNSRRQMRQVAPAGPAPGACPVRTQGRRDEVFRIPERVVRSNNGVWQTEIRIEKVHRRNDEQRRTMKGGR